MKFNEIIFSEIKTYKVTKAVKLALLKGVVVRDGEVPEIPAENSVESEEALILGMTDLTLSGLEELSEDDYNKVLDKINSIVIAPKKAS